jgi:hypothetical protein
MTATKKPRVRIHRHACTRMAELNGNRTAPHGRRVRAERRTSAAVQKRWRYMPATHTQSDDQRSEHHLLHNRGEVVADPIGVVTSAVVDGAH